MGGNMISVLHTISLDREHTNRHIA